MRSSFLRPVRLLFVKISNFALSFIGPALRSFVWGSRLGLMINTPQSTNNSLSAEAFPPCVCPHRVLRLHCHKFRRPASLIQHLFLWMKLLRPWHRLSAQAEASLQSTSTAISSSSPAAASISSHRSDLRVPEHSRISVGPPISSPYTNSVALSGRLALPPFVNTFTPAPAISSICSPALSGSVLLSLASPKCPTFVPTTSLRASLPTVIKKAFITGTGHAPIPHKLVMKITGGHFLDLADLLSANLRGG